MNYYNLQQPITFEPNTEIPNTEMVAISAIQEVGKAQNTINYLIKYNEDLKKTLHAEQRRKRRKVTSKDIVSMENQDICIITHYDNGECSAEKLITNVRGNIYVSRVQFSSITDQNEYYMIQVGERENAIYILVQRCKVRGMYLYERFIERGIAFNQTISKADIQDVLLRYFLRQFNSNQNIITVQTFAGWYAENYYYKEKSVLGEFFGTVEVPILRKSFHKKIPDEYSWDVYFAEMSKISDWKYRILVMLCPVLGIMSSLLRDEKKPMKIFLNFVFGERFSKERINAWIKIFNRDDLQAYSVDTSKKEIDTIIRETRDEVLVMDGCVNEYESTYTQKKKIENLKRVGNIITGESSGNIAGYTPCSAMFVAFANQYITGGNVFNIFITKEFLNEKDDENGRELLMNNVMEAFFSQMIVYMEKNIETVRSAIRKKRHTNDYSSEPFYAAYEIVGQFWQTEGIDFVQKAGLPTSVDFTWLFEDSLDNDEELMQLFIKAVRKNIQHFKGVEKNSRSKYMLYAIYYNETYLWFPTKVLKKILGHECLKPDMTKILFMLKRDSNLIADTDGFTRKLQIEGTRFETYQIKRDLFNQDGMADIINLTKESEKC